MQVVQGSREFVPTKASTINNSTLAIAGLQIIFPTRASKTSNLAHQGLQSICPTKASRNSNSTQAIIGLLERFSYRGSGN